MQRYVEENDDHSEFEENSEPFSAGGSDAEESEVSSSEMDKPKRKSNKSNTRRPQPKPRSKAPVKRTTVQNMRPTASNVVEIDDDDDFGTSTPIATNRTLATEVSIPLSLQSETKGKKRQLPLNFGSQSMGRKSNLTSNWE